MQWVPINNGSPRGILYIIYIIMYMHVIYSYLKQNWAQVHCTFTASRNNDAAESVYTDIYFIQQYYSIIIIITIISTNVRWPIFVGSREELLLYVG